MKNTNLFLSEKELSRAKALEEKLLNYIQTHNIKRDQCNKYSKKLRISKSDKNLLNRYYSFNLVATKLYIENLRNHIKRSQQFNWEHGICTFKAPLGYVNYRDKNGRAQIKVDSERLQKIYKLFLARRDGASLEDLYQLAKDMKLKFKRRVISKDHILRILHNKFYAGKMVINGKTYQHKYPIMVPPELFEEVQQTFKERRLKWKI